MAEEAREFWEKKIFGWERARYSPWLYFYPPSWPIRRRLNSAYKILCERVAQDCSILELGCGSGLLAEKARSRYRNYLGIDLSEKAVQAARRRVPEFKFIAQDVLHGDLEQGDVTVFLGLVDWLGEGDFEKLIGKIKSSRILFSYTRNLGWEPYRMYRLAVDRPNRPSARSYTFNEIQSILSRHRFTYEALTSPSIFNPGVLVWASRMDR